MENDTISSKTYISETNRVMTVLRQNMATICLKKVDETCESGGGGVRDRCVTMLEVKQGTVISITLGPQNER